MTARLREAWTTSKRRPTATPACRWSDANHTVAAQVGGKGFNGPSRFAFTLDGDRVTLIRITG